MILDQLLTLRVQSREGWRPLSGWAAFFVRLGFNVGRHTNQDRKLTVAVAVPTRAVAAAFAAAGIVAGEISRGLADDPGTRPFEELLLLPPGTPVLLERAGRQFRGVVVGPATLAGESWIGVRIQHEKTGGETHYVRSADSGRISVGDNESLPLPGRPQGVAVTPRPAFVRQAFGYQGFDKVTGETNLDCLLLGRSGRLKEELASFQVGLPGTRGLIEGYLNDFVRTRQVLGPGRTYRGFIASPTTPSPRPALTAAKPRTVVFDGGSGFLKWRHHWRGAHWLVVLDRTDARCAETVAALNGDYESKSSGVATDLASIPRPDSIELTAFYTLRA